MKRKIYNYIENHNLVNRIYDMLDYFSFFKYTKKNEKELKNGIKANINSIYYVETLAKYLECKRKKNKKNIDLKCNLDELINDLNYLKQYLCKN